jgi:tellurite resistance protein TerC
LSSELALWIVFGVVVTGVLALDLGVFHRKAHVVHFKEALAWSAVWIGLSLLFNLGVFIWRGSDDGVNFLTAYLIEKSLSVDNVFVFALIFAYFKVPGEYQHRVLFWGILGALIMRAILIAVGITLLEHFHFVIYIFGGFLIFSAYRLVKDKGKEINPEKNPLIRLAKKVIPTTTQYHGSKFFVLKGAKHVATPLFIVLLVVEVTDLVFAVDSIPAVLAISTDTFIVYTSNVFAILGLRALYFALAGVIQMFHLLHYGLAVILAWVGVKMLMSDVWKAPVALSLGVVAAILVLSVALSMKYKPRAKEHAHAG